MSKIEIFVFPNGNYAVLKDGQQVVEAQGSWLLLIARRLEAAGIDPLEAEISLPGELRRARFFRTGDGGLNWRIAK